MTHDVAAVRVSRKKKNIITHKVTDHRGIRIGHIHVSIDHRVLH